MIYGSVNELARQQYQASVAVEAVVSQSGHSGDVTAGARMVRFLRNCLLLPQSAERNPVVRTTLKQA
jgi:hypothetical protein